MQGVAETFNTFNQHAGDTFTSANFFHRLKPVATNSQLLRSQAVDQQILFYMMSCGIASILIVADVSIYLKIN